MLPLRALLDRIRWDETFGRGDFTLGYYDRLEGRMLIVPLMALHFDPGNHTRFRLCDAAGVFRSIPLHRVYAVYRNGVCIWRRLRR